MSSCQTSYDTCRRASGLQEKHVSMRMHGHHLSMNYEMIRKSDDCRLRLRKLNAFRALKMVMKLRLESRAAPKIPQMDF
eukprot:1159499-Pelagomonas_calceolata.AAC.10